MSATAPSYPAHLITAQADSGSTAGSFLAWLFGNRDKKPVALVGSTRSTSPLLMSRPPKMPTPTILRLPESVAAELMSALQTCELRSARSRQYDAAGFVADAAKPTPIASRPLSTSALETQVRDFPIV